SEAAATQIAEQHHGAAGGAADHVDAAVAVPIGGIRHHANFEVADLDGGGKKRPRFAADVAIVAHLAVSIADHKVESAVAIEIGYGEGRPRALKHIEIHLLPGDRSDLERLAAFPLEHRSFLVEACRRSTPVSGQEDVALVGGEEQIKPAVAVEIGELREYPRIAARGGMLDLVAACEQRDGLIVAVSLVEVDRQSAEDVHLAVAVPVDELEAPCRQ